jgi:hypothetical protein
VDKVIQPGVKAHNIQLVKTVVTQKYTQRPNDEQQPECLAEVSIYGGVRVTNNDKETRVDQQDQQIL